jgi:hypothetical protein
MPRIFQFPVAGDARLFPHSRVRLAAGRVRLAADLAIPAAAKGMVLFAHGSGSGRLSPRNRLVAAKLQQAGLATLLLDLLTAEEEKAERAGGRLRFDVQLLAGRLAVVPGASHLFPEPGALERVAELADAWFLAHLAGELASEPATS